MAVALTACYWGSAGFGLAISAAGSRKKPIFCKRRGNNALGAGRASPRSDGPRKILAARAAAEGLIDEL